jgi:hypothetical protein
MPDPIPKLLVCERLPLAMLALGAAGCALMDMKWPVLRLGLTADRWKNTTARGRR